MDKAIDKQCMIVLQHVAEAIGNAMDDQL